MLKFGDDLNPGPDLRICDSSPLGDMVKNDIKHNISKGYGWIHMKLGGEIGSATRNNLFNFGAHRSKVKVTARS